MPLDKTWAMNCVLAGVEVAKMIGRGQDEEAYRYLMNLTSEFDTRDALYLLYRIKEGN